MLTVIVEGVDRNVMFWEAGHPGCPRLMGNSIGDLEKIHNWGVFCMLSETKPGHRVVILD